MKTARDVAAAATDFAAREYANAPGWRLAIAKHFAEGFYGLRMVKTQAANADATAAYHAMQDAAYAAGIAFQRENGAETGADF